ncbi:MAG: TRAP transporter small permease subunit [Hyphomicrobiaceae bacterium]
MSLLLMISRVIDHFNERLGRGVAWLTVVAILVSATNATIRKLFDTSSNAWLELQWVLFSAVFLICASWTLASNEHIRIDIVNNMLPQRMRHWIELIGHALFLMPITVLMVYLSWSFFTLSLPSAHEAGAGIGRVFQALLSFSPSAIADAWSGLLALGEQSTNAGGLPQWPAKLLIPVGFFLLGLQGISELIKRVAIMSGHLPDLFSTDHHPSAAKSLGLNNEAGNGTQPTGASRGDAR